MATSQGSPTPRGGGDENGEQQQRRPEAPRPVPTPADVFPPRGGRRPAARPPQEPADRDGRDGEGREGRDGGGDGRGGENSSQDGR
ncbi:hypothetical protein [Streptomyces sp. NPDC049881]|uniref:hypothetical protein n=1 Tax=unclassified Streptomyces TaxID=2593676 RepID=UPI0034124CB0